MSAATTAPASGAIIGVLKFKFRLVHSGGTGLDMRKKAFVILFSLLLATFSCGLTFQRTSANVSAGLCHEESGAIRVALYNGSGDSGAGACKACVRAMELMFEWMGCNVTRVTFDDIINGRLDGYDVLAWPGGDYTQYWQVGPQGRAYIQKFISDGGGYYGTCAGAWWACDYMIWKADPAYPPPDYKVEGDDLNLDLFPGVAVGPIEEIGPFHTDLVTKINIVNHDHPITRLWPNQITVFYVGGPELLPYQGANVTVLGLYDATGTPAMVAFGYGNGRVFLTGPHPEFEEDSDRDGFPPEPGLTDPESEWPLMLNVIQWLAQRIPQPVGGLVLPAEAPTYTAMLIIAAIAAGAAAVVFARKRLPP